MEFVDGGSILDKIKKQGKPLSEEQIAIIVHEVLLGLDYLSRSNKIHRSDKRRRGGRWRRRTEERADNERGACVHLQLVGDLLCACFVSQRYQSSKQ